MGRSLFNQHCGHCHGPNAIQGERPLDLRRLTLRYGDRAPTVFDETMSTGRLAKGGHFADTFTPATLADQPPLANDAKCGLACHTIVKIRDYVFTDYGKR